MKTFIFDLDGTLLDTLEDIGDACNVILKKYGFPQHKIQDYRKMVGNGFDMLMRRALPDELAQSPDRLSALTSEAKNYYLSNLYNKTEPYSGIIEMLEKMLSEDRKLAVLSNKPDKMTKEIITHFFPKIPFLKVQGALPALPLKPSPIALLNMLNELSCPAVDCCYVGDSEVDVRTGKNASIKTIAVSWGFRDRDELERENPDIICDRPSQLISIWA